MREVVFLLELGFTLAVCSMKFAVYLITTVDKVMGFRTQCIPAELTWSGVTDGLE